MNFLWKYTALSWKKITLIIFQNDHSMLIWFVSCYQNIIECIYMHLSVDSHTLISRNNIYDKST